MFDPKSFSFGRLRLERSDQATGSLVCLSQVGIEVAYSFPNLDPPWLSSRLAFGHTASRRLSRWTFPHSSGPSRTGAVKRLLLGSAWQSSTLRSASSPSCGRGCTSGETWSWQRWFSSSSSFLGLLDAWFDSLSPALSLLQWEAWRLLLATWRETSSQPTDSAPAECSPWSAWRSTC